MQKDVLSAADLSRADILDIFRLSDQLKRMPWVSALRERIVALIFEKPSTRTRFSFEAGIVQLGGTPIYVDASTTQLARGESIHDTAKVLERYVNAVVARVNRHATLTELASNAKIPVINALSDLEHPCQALADFFTIKEKLGKLRGVVVAFIGDPNNVFNSLAIMGNVLGAEIRIASPPEYRPSSWLKEKLRDIGGDISWFKDPEEAVRDADVVYTDVFVSMGQEAERAKKLGAFLPKYRVTAELISKTGKNTVFMHCLPAHRGEEVTDEVIDASYSVVFDQAENRLHVQKALLVKLSEEGYL